MSKEYLIQYASVAAAAAAVIIDRKGVAKYVPVALFSNFYANIVCFIALYFKWWDYPKALWGFVDNVSVTVNFIVLPATVIIWVKHIPSSFWGKALWALLWSVGLTGVELVLERFTDIIKYHNGYDWYYSFILWLISWYIWSAYHKWQIKRILRLEKT